MTIFAVEVSFVFVFPIKFIMLTLKICEKNQAFTRFLRGVVTVLDNKHLSLETILFH